MKIAITGKGGVGKTTLAGVLARLLAEKGKKVLAVDADPDANLASAIGFSEDEVEKIEPIASLKDLIKERTGAEPGQSGSFFSMNPKVDDIPDKYSLNKDSIKLLVMGAVEKGGVGCICPESALIRQLVKHLVIARDEVVIMDMEAGIEHLGRATAEAVDAFIVVIEPGLRSVQTAKTIKKLAADIGIKNIYVVINKASPGLDAKNLVDSLGGLKLIGTLP
ncbi:MAG: adenylyl-sulfate kinase, partial [Actinobacteria bacterium]